MTVREAVFMCCRQKGFSLSVLAEMVGMDRGNLSHAISETEVRCRTNKKTGQMELDEAGDKMKVGTLRRLVEACGGQLVVQFLDEGMDVEDEFVIDGCEEGVLEEETRAFPNS